MNDDYDDTSLDSLVEMASPSASRGEGDDALRLNGDEDDYYRGNEDVEEEVEEHYTRESFAPEDGDGGGDGGDGDGGGSAESVSLEAEDEYDSDEEEPMTMDERAEVVTAILKPVAITMFIVVWIIENVNLPLGEVTNNVTVYHEKTTDKTSVKLTGSIINALVIVAVITVVTFIFVLLYKYRCLKIIWAWLLMSTCMLLGGFGFLMLYFSLVSFNIPMDLVTFALLIWNFAVGGLVAIFWHAPTRVTQGYLIVVSVLMAIYLTRWKEWTTFTVLIAIATYDIFAVLCPQGPLKILVETAQERQEPIPALLYSGMVWMGMAYPEDLGMGEEHDDAHHHTTDTPDGGDDAFTTLRDDGDNNDNNNNSNNNSNNTPGGDDDDGASPLRTVDLHDDGDSESATPESAEAGFGRRRVAEPRDKPDREIIEFLGDKKKSVKLGLGDFVFYSLLVGRAAMFDIITTFTTFIGIITGLFCTLLLLAIFKRALPALPFSIYLGIFFFFVSRVFLVPYVCDIGARSIFV